jgi:hypothetical protein
MSDAKKKESEIPNPKDVDKHVETEDWDREE